jgi:hypothetical protein
MRAMVLWAAGVLGFAVMGADKPKFADLRAGDAVVAVVRFVENKEGQTRRFLIQRRENGWVVSAWNLNEQRFKEGLVGRIGLEDAAVEVLDKILGEVRIRQGNPVAEGETSVAFFWQCSGVQREEKLVDTWLESGTDGISLPQIYRAIEKLEQ